MGERNTFEADFEFTLAILDAFFAQRQIRTALAMIADNDISGWEKWWQIELALFLSEHEDVAEGIWRSLSSQTVVITPRKIPWPLICASDVKDTAPRDLFFSN